MKQGGFSRERPVHGRERELALLQRILEPEGPEVVAVSGLPGIGKSALLRAFVRGARAPRGRVQLLDCRTVEPTEASFESALEEFEWPPDAGGPRVLCLDHYDSFFLLDAWLRQRLQSEVEGGLRLVLATREGLGVGWTRAGTLVSTVRLDTLAEEETRSILLERGVRAETLPALMRLTRGHPMAIELALASPVEVEGGVPDAPPAEVVWQLTRYFLEHVKDARTREALEAASTVRRLSRPLLAALLASEDETELYEQLAFLPLVERRRDGLSLHPTVHEAMARWLRTSDPARFTALRRSAWETLEREGRSVSTRDLWRFTADAIFLVDNPIVHEAFFPSATQPFAIETATDADHQELLSLAESHGPSGEREHLARWLEQAPEAWSVVRDVDGLVCGGYLLLDPARTSAQALEADPLTRAWLRRIEPHHVPGQSDALFLRRWLGRHSGDLPSSVQAACWLDVKRAYLEGRPSLRWVCLAVSDLAPYAAAAAELGFKPMDAPGPLASALLDFGHGSVDAWLARLVRQSLGLQALATLDGERRTLILNGVCLPLTPRESDLVEVLLEARGAAVTREELLDRVWDGGYAVGSNVLDVLVRGLRKKLGDQAGLLETVRGTGYRWRV